MAVRYPRSPGLGVKLDTELYEITVGKSEVARYGEDLAILALGAMVAPAREAAEKLASRGIEATVVNTRFAKPLDSSLIIDLAGRIKRVVTVEENVLSGGFGGGVMRLLQESGISDVQAVNIGIPDKFIEHGTQAFLRAKYGLDTEGIVKRTLKLFPECSLDTEPKTTDKAKAT